MKIFTKWADREHSLTRRVLVSLLAGFFVAFLIPLGLVSLGPKLDSLLHLPSISFGLVNFILGTGIVIFGFSFALWSVLSQLLRAGGSPVPVMPTHKLLTDGPFSYCRNPMTLGAICVYTGIGIIAGSLSSVMIAFLLAALLITYLKRIEEHELALRFGQEYLDYKAATPFLVPGVFKRQVKKHRIGRQ